MKPTRKQQEVPTMVDLRSMVLDALSVLVRSQEKKEISLGSGMAEAISALWHDDDNYYVGAPPDIAPLVNDLLSRDQKELTPYAARLWWDIEVLSADGEPPVLLDPAAAMLVLGLLVSKDLRQRSVIYAQRNFIKV